MFQRKTRYSISILNTILLGIQGFILLYSLLFILTKILFKSKLNGHKV